MNVEEMLVEFSELENLKRETERELDTLKTAIIAAMNGVDSLTAGYHTAIVTTCKRQTIDAKKLASDLPLIYNQYCKQSTYKRFTVK